MTDDEDEIQESEWIKVVRIVKRQIASSLFFMRDYSACECVLDSDSILSFL